MLQPTAAQLHAAQQAAELHFLLLALRTTAPVEPAQGLRLRCLGGGPGTQPFWPSASAAALTAAVAAARAAAARMFFQWMAMVHTFLNTLLKRAKVCRQRA